MGILVGISAVVVLFYYESRVLLILMVIMMSFTYSPSYSTATNFSGVRGDIVENCKELNLRDSAFCLRDNILPYYNYTYYDSTLLSKSSTIQTLNKEGGNNYDWCSVYSKIADQLGFRKPAILTFAPEVLDRSLTIINDDTGYCIMDGIADPYCKEYVR